MIGFRTPRPADESPLDPAIAAELAALDAALGGDAIDDAALAALVRDVQVAAPEMAPEARAALNERFAEPAPKRRPRRRFAAVGSGALATVLVGAFAVTALQPQGENGAMLDAGSTAPRVTNEASSAAAAPGDEQASNSDLPASAVAPGTGTDGESTAAQRRVQRAATLEVRVERAKLAGTAREVEVITRAAGGYVADSQLTLGTRAGESSNGSFTLRVRSARLDDALGRLGRLGVVTGQQRSSQDITAQSDSAARRLRVAEREREALLRALGKADRSAEIASLRRRLDDNQRSRSALRREVAELKQQSDLATIALTLTAAVDGEPLAGDQDGGWGLGDAADDAGRVLDVLAGVLLLVAVVLLPFTALAVIGWVLVRARRRRLREAALDD